MANLKDFATGTVLTAPSPANSGNTMLLQNNEHLRMPAVPFYATAHPDNTLPTIDNSEKILVTDINAGTQVMTFSRAQGVATAKNIAAGWRISNTIFAADLYNGTDVRNEVPAGAINGTNTFYMIAAAFTPGSLNVYVNGQRMKSGSGNDYVENATLTGFTMQYALQTGDVLFVDYTIGSSVMMNGVNVEINQEIPTGAVNGSNAAFTTTRPYVSGTLKAYVNGLLQAPGTHVTEVSPAAGTYTLDVAPDTGDIVRVSYNYAVSTGGNAASVNGIAANTTPTANQLLPLDSSSKFPLSVLPSGTAWATVPYAAGWGDYDATTNQWVGGRYMKDIAGFVHLKGLVRNVSGSTKAGGSTIATLPVGFRPSNTMRAAVAGAVTASPAITWITILYTGEIQSDSSIPNSEWISLGGINFMAEN